MKDLSDNDIPSNSSSVRLTPAQKKKLLQEQLLNKIKGKSTSTNTKTITNQTTEKSSVKRTQENDQNEQNSKIQNVMKENENTESKSSSSSTRNISSQFIVPPIKTTWTIPRVIKNKKPISFDALRQEMNVTATGENIPPIIPKFSQMHLPTFLVDYFKEKGYDKPTTLQMQCLPAAFMGRDVIGIASHNKGKTIIGLLVSFLFAVEEEMKLSLTYDEGPIGIILCYSKENAIRIYEKLESWNDLLRKNQFPILRNVLCIGGESITNQVKKIRQGCHLVIATPGRLCDHLQKRNISLNICKLVCIDDAEKVLCDEIGEDVKSILNAFKHHRQLIVLTTSFPKPFIGFARDYMTNPIIVNAGEREMKRTDIDHNVQSVADTERSVYIVKKCLNLTPPPVIIFTHVPKNVDEIEEYLLLKGLDVASVSPQMTYYEEKKVVDSLIEKKIDILIATDYSKNDIVYPQVNHVINYDIPSDFSLFLKRQNCVKENGISTTFISPSTPEIALRELKYYLLKTKQKIPECMKLVKNEKEIVVEKDDTCLWCGRSGHSILNCPKL